MLANKLLDGFMKSETSLQEKDDDELKLVKTQNCVLKGKWGLQRVVLCSGYFNLLFFDHFLCLSCITLNSDHTDNIPKKCDSSEQH